MNFDWVTPGTGQYSEYPTSVAAAPGNSVVVTGSIGPDARFQEVLLKGGNLATNVFNGFTNVTANGVAFVAKYSESGSLEWILQDEGSTNSIARAVAVDKAGAIYAAGEFTGVAKFGAKTLTNLSAMSDLFLLKLGPDGSVLWLKQAGGTNVDFAYGLAVDLDGNCYVTGFCSGQVKFGPGVEIDTGLNQYGSGISKAYVVKYDSEGNAVWARVPAGTGSSTGWGLLVNSGKIYNVGAFVGTNTFGGVTFKNTSDYLQHAYIAVYSPAGEVESALAATSVNGVAGSAITSDAANNIYITGYFNGPAVFGGITLNSVASFGFERFIARVSSGGFSWARTLDQNINYNDGGIAGAAEGFYLATSLSRSATIDGTFFSISPSAPQSFGGGDLIVMQFDAAGKLVNGKTAGGGYDDGGAAIAVLDENSVVATGWFKKSAAFDAFTLIGDPASDQFATEVFVAKLSSGNVQPPQIFELSCRNIGETGELRWPANANARLQTRNNVNAGDWIDFPGTVSTENGTNIVRFPHSGSRQFFRLIR